MNAAMTDLDDNKKLIRTLHDWINARKLDELQTPVTPDFTGPRGARGPAESSISVQQ